MRDPRPRPGSGRACALGAAGGRSQGPRPSPAGRQEPDYKSQGAGGEGARASLRATRAQRDHFPARTPLLCPAEPGSPGRTSGKPQGPPAGSQPCRRTSQILVVVVVTQSPKFLPSVSSLPPHLLPASGGHAIREPAPSALAFGHHGEWDEQGNVSFLHLCCFASTFQPSFRLRLPGARSPRACRVWGAGRRCAGRRRACVGGTRARRFRRAAPRPARPLCG